MRGPPLMPQGMKLPQVYVSGGKMNKQLARYLNMPVQVMRNGVMVNIRENNARVFDRKA